MIYSYEKCCGRDVDRVCGLAAYEADSSFSCPSCGRPLARVICAPRILLHTKPFEAFRSPIDGSVIASRRELSEHNKRNDVVNTHDGYDEKTILDFVNKDHRKTLNEAASASVRADADLAVDMLHGGHIPVLRPEGVIPDE